MFDLCKLIVGTMVDLLRSRAMLEAEILMLRQQINVLRRANPKRLRFASIDRLSIWRGGGGPPSLGWKTFLHNHADDIAAMDLFVVPTISFRLLYGLLIMGHGRRQILWFGVTAHPDRRMDRKSGHGSMRLGTSSPLSDPRSGRCLWRGLHPKTSIDGHSRSTHVATLAMAKRICRKANRFDPTGLS